MGKEGGLETPPHICTAASELTAAAYAQVRPPPYFGARGKPSTVFPRAGLVETERFSLMRKIQQNHYTIDNSSANQFENAPPSV